MIIDLELKAMSEVFDALHSLDSSTQKRVVDWVLSKLESEPSSRRTTAGAKRGRKPSSKLSGNKRGRKPVEEASIAISNVGAKRGPKPGKKRGPKPGSTRQGKRGRPPGTKNKQNA